MSFGEELRNLASDVSLENRVWEEMKPYLRKIAKRNHPKGCHIVFEGETKTFIEGMKKVIEDEGIYFEYNYFNSERDGSNYGNIIWEESKFSNAFCYGQRDMSNELLRVIFEKTGKVSIKIEKLEKQKSEFLYQYIS